MNIDNIASINNVIINGKFVEISVRSFVALIYIFFNSINFTKSVSLLKQTGSVTSLSTSNLSTLLFKLFKLAGTFFNL